MSKSKFPEGCTITLRPDGKLEQFRTKDGSLINNIVRDSIEIRQSLHEANIGLKRVKLEIYIRPEDIKIIDDTDGNDTGYCD